MSNLVGKQVKGTIQVHAVILVEGVRIAVKNTSCLCNACFVDTQTVSVCDGWTIYHMSSDTNLVCNIATNSNSAQQVPGHAQNDLITDQEPDVDEPMNTNELYKVNKYVAAIYIRQQVVSWANYRI